MKNMFRFQALDKDSVASADQIISSKNTRFRRALVTEMHNENSLCVATRTEHGIELYNSITKPKAVYEGFAVS
jgi:hypothetical protein